MKRSALIRTAAIGAACALVGGAAGIAESSASTTTHKTSARLRNRIVRNGELAAGPAIARGFAGPFVKGFAAPVMTAGGTPEMPVHTEAVVPNEKGGFETVTMDSGTFSSLSGEHLTINEGTRKATYKAVTLTIPSDATVYRNGEKASISDLKSGDMVMVAQSSSGTVVSAFDEQHEPKLKVMTRVTRGGHGKETSVEGEGGGPALTIKATPAPPGGAGSGGSAETNEEGEEGSSK